jgi:hypothetical protein
MSGRTAVLAALSLALAGCGSSHSSPSPDCLASAQAVENALAAAPGPVAIDGLPLSQCVARAQSQADLEAVGTTFTGAADDLSKRAGRDPTAALRLGYLVGATERGGSHSAGIDAELVRRIELDGALPAAATKPALRALAKGISAGRRVG